MCVLLEGAEVPVDRLIMVERVAPNGVRRIEKENGTPKKTIIVPGKIYSEEDQHQLLPITYFDLFFLPRVERVEKGGNTHTLHLRDDFTTVPILGMVFLASVYLEENIPYCSDHHHTQGAAAEC